MLFFTCLTTRAIHIEVDRSLDKDSCLVAINRFIARRGNPAIIISDNGTNFVGSARELKDYINSWNKDQITSDLAQKNIVWKFNPPRRITFCRCLGEVSKKLQEGNGIYSGKSIFYR